MAKKTRTLIPEPHPLPPNNADTLQLFLNWFFPAFNVILVFVFFTYFHDRKQDVADFAIYCGLMIFLLAFITSQIVPNLGVGLWYPLLPEIVFFRLP